MKEEIWVGVGFDIDGVHLFAGKTKATARQVFRVEPEFAMQIAQELTLGGIRVEELRKSSGGSSNGKP